MGRPPKPRGSSAAGTISPSIVPNLFLWGVGGLVLSVALTFVFPKVEPVQAAGLALLLGLSGAAIATGITGIVKLNTKAVIATGPFVVFILAFWAVMSTGAPNAFPDFLSLFKWGSKER